MSLKALISRITHRGSRRSSEADRVLADARSDAALQRRKQADRSTYLHATGGGYDGGGF